MWLLKQYQREATLPALKMEKDTMSEVMQAASRKWKRQGNRLSPRAYSIVYRISDLQKYKIRNLCCFKFCVLYGNNRNLKGSQLRAGFLQPLAMTRLPCLVNLLKICIFCFCFEVGGVLDGKQNGHKEEKESGPLKSVDTFQGWVKEQELVIQLLFIHMWSNWGIWPSDNLEILWDWAGSTALWLITKNEPSASGWLVSALECQWLLKNRDKE